MIRNVLWLIHSLVALWHAFVQTGLSLIQVESVPKVKIFVFPIFLAVSDTWPIQNYSVQLQPQCLTNQDCSNPEICHQGSCVDACRLTTCGSNARCKSANHAGICECLHGFVGNPSTGCQPCKFFVLEIHHSQLLSLNYVLARHGFLE